VSSKYKIPENLLYTKTHEWAKLLDDGTVLVGITDYAQDALHEIVYVELPEKGKKVTAGEAFMSVESVKAVSEVYAPVSGEVVEINEILTDHPEKINEDPYGEGWLVKIKPSSWDEDSKKLLNATDYQKVVEEEAQK